MILNFGFKKADGGYKPTSYTKNRYYEMPYESGREKTLKNHRIMPITSADTCNGVGTFHHFLVINFLWDLLKFYPLKVLYPQI